MASESDDGYCRSVCAVGSRMQIGVANLGEQVNVHVKGETECHQRDGVAPNSVSGHVATVLVDRGECLIVGSVAEQNVHLEFVGMLADELDNSLTHGNVIDETIGRKSRKRTKLTITVPRDRQSH